MIVKKVLKILLAATLLLNVNSLYSQFYDTKRIRKIATIGTVTENSDLPVFSKTPSVSSTAVPPTAVADTLKVSAPENPLFSPPLMNLVVSSHYGYRNDPFTGKRKFHHGTDFLTNCENVFSMMPGRIRKIGYNKVLGNYIELDHGEFRVTYAHLHTVIGEKGDYVAAGQSIGISGSTGRSTGEHLHLSMRYKNKSVDPYPLVKYIATQTRQLINSLPPDSLSVQKEQAMLPVTGQGQP